MPPLLILRHGETEWNATGRLQGRFDSALTQTGHAQAMQQRDILASCDLTGFRSISSPQGRAYQTAQIALNGLIPQIETDLRLREIGLGDWAGHRRDALMEEHGAEDGFDLYQMAPGGEGFTMLHDRCADFLNDLGGPTVIVTHGITSRMLRVVALGKSLQSVRTIGGGQGVVFQIVDGQQHCLAKGA